MKLALLSPCQGRSKHWAPSSFIFSDTFPIFFWCGKQKKYIYLCWGTWGKSGLKKTILVKTHIFEVKFRPNEGRQPGHTRPQQVGWWSSWSDLDLEFDLQGQGKPAIKMIAGPRVNSPTLCTYHYGHIFIFVYTT